MRVLNYLVLFGSAFALVLAGAQAFIRRPDWKNLLLALLWLSVAAWQGAAGGGELLRERVLAYNISVVIANCSYAASAPLFYLYFYRSIITANAPRFQDGLHFLPPTACLLLYVTMAGQLENPGFEKLPAPLIAEHLAALSMLAYLLLVIYRIHGLARATQGVAGSLANTIRNMALFILPLAILANFFWSIYINAAATLILIAVFWMSIRFPRLFHLLRKEGEKARYEKSRLAGLDADELAARLRQLMESEKLYVEENIRLKDIAHRLDLSEYQLSEFLNTKLNMNFHGFLNGYRIEEARRLLKKDPSLSALAAGLQVGFNSNSAFYNAFRSETGMSPGQFRKSEHGKSPKKPS